ncbi:MAG TPA: O-antigen ligase family protein [Pirellulales bacterium]|jgi:O-antigen ligase|nr:O-antigen ligase family protein [Pirellulales bacterium]
MKSFDSPTTHRSSAADATESALQSFLARVVDAGLIGVPLLTPWFMGGRHPLGELVIVLLAVAVALAWLGRRALDPRTATWTGSPGEWVVLGAVLLVIAQIVPWPQPVLDLLSPHTRQLLPLWRGDATVPGTLGTWNQVSMTPEWTRAGLTLLLAYGMLFLVAVQRLRTIDDVQWLLRWIGVAVFVQAVFGIVQYLTTNGKFVWIYQHPFRDTWYAVTGAYINRNHFAHLMALGLGPLACLVAASLSRKRPAGHGAFAAGRTSTEQIRLLAWTLALGIVLLAGLMTSSRGGAVAMLVATLLLCGALYRARLLSWRFPVAMIGIFALIGSCLAIHGYRNVADRLDDYTAGSIEELDQGGPRRAIWDADFKALPDYAWFGAGVGSHREIYPMYLTDSWEVEFTHAENGYLQIALEAGVPGLVLMLAAIGLCAFWCRRGLSAGVDPKICMCTAAVAAGMAASVVHSLVDFVWYIPSLAAVTILLSAAAYRLALLSRGNAAVGAARVAGSPWQWRLAPLAISLVGGWMIYDRFCATMAEPHWDHFLSYALKEPQEGDKAVDPTILPALENVLYWTPDNAKAHIRLASLLLGRFEQLQQAAANAMPLNQISEAAMASRSRFSSAADLDAWLNRAIGENRRLLSAALWHLDRGISLCALMGEGYVHLADLCFLKGQGQAERLAYLNQALTVRPYDGVVLLSAGSAAALRGDVDAMIAYWRPVLRCRQQERQAMVRLLTAMPIPVEEVLSAFQPDLPAVRMLYARYSQMGVPQPLQVIGAYYVQGLGQAIQRSDAESAAQLWFEMHHVYHAMNQPAQGVECMRRAVAGRPTDFNFHFVLAQRLNEQQKFAEAEQELKWCAQRRPDNQDVKAALAEAVSGRVDQQTRGMATPANYITK